VEQDLKVKPAVAKCLDIYRQFIKETQRRKQQSVFVWYERMASTVGALWLFDAIIGFKNQTYGQLINWLAWLLTAVSVADLMWFAYRCHRQQR
jgi:hypothetical protein